MLDQLCQSARNACFDLIHQLWPDVTALHQERELEWLRLRLRRGYENLIRQRNSLQSALARILQNEKQETALTYRIEAYMQGDNRVKAFHHALELDQLRHTLQRDRGELPHLQRAYENRMADITAMEARVADIQERVDAQRLRAADANA
ncbi:MAG: hypothetical protein K2R98_17380 [Gemmataceae bacterium]|nr:hypothetical protein [Gemmataceae bacterium]